MGVNNANTARKVDLLSISALKNKKFHIPGYQRGYKWRKSDVKNLICDIEEIKEDEGDYCLQPIVVASLNDEYILVDGQQRLTTIWLITNWAKTKNYKFDFVDYSINYEGGRDDSNNFLRDLKEKGYGKDIGTCDTHYLNDAIDTINELESHLEKFFENLYSKVKIIWYEVNPEDGPSKFERLNSSRIGLTNAELMKALIMTNMRCRIIVSSLLLQIATVVIEKITIGLNWYWTYMPEQPATTERKMSIPRLIQLPQRLRQALRQKTSGYKFVMYITVLKVGILTMTISSII